MEKASREGGRLIDRAEYKSKPKPLTCPPDTTVSGAVAAMSDKSYGCVIVVDENDRAQGIVTERDIMNKIVGKGLDPKTTRLGEIMSHEPRMAREEDNMIDWLRIMSNERFRRLPVIDDDGRVKAVFTQGDFVSYTWPDLMDQAKNIARATVFNRFHYFLIGGGILIYALAMVVVLASV